MMSATDQAASKFSVCLRRPIEAEDSKSYGNLGPSKSEPGEVIFTAGWRSSGNVENSCIYASCEGRIMQYHWNTARLVKSLFILLKNPLVMVGVPGKSKGCTTCRRRKIRVSTLYARCRQSSTNADVSATFKSHSARRAPRAVESAKATLVFPFFSTVPWRVQKRGMASKKPKPHSRKHQIEIYPSHSPWYPPLTSNGDL